MFNLHAALLWTISDFPAYANLSGWSTKGEFACPCCNKHTRSRWLSHGRKFCYMGHRRFLPIGHKFRKDRVSFGGKWEWGSKPPQLSGVDILRQMSGVLTDYKDDLRKRKRGEFEIRNNSSKKQFWKKKSIFF